MLGSTRDFDLTHSRGIFNGSIKPTCKDVVGVRLPPLQHFVTRILKGDQ